MTNLREKLTTIIRAAVIRGVPALAEQDADAVLSTLTAEGMVIVPTEPAEAMVRAANIEADEYYFASQDNADAHVCLIYTAMITALEGNRE